jgi:anti-sigma factor RsiW
MNEHNEIRNLLALAAAGALEPDEQAKLNAHLRGCKQCAARLDSFSNIATALGKLPPAGPPLGLAARTRARVSAELMSQAERRSHHLLVGLLICFGWILTLATLFLGRHFAAGLGQIVGVPPAPFVGGLISYAFFSALASAAFAGVIGPRLQATRRTYEPFS